MPRSRKMIYVVGGVRLEPNLVKRVHKSGLVLEASIREKRRSKAVMRRFREGQK